MTEEELRALYRDILEETGRRPEPEALLQALEGEGPEEERLAILDRALATEAGRRELDLLRTLRDGRELRTRPVRSGPGGLGRLTPLALAATLVLAAVGVLRWGGGDPDTLRSGAAEPTIRSPAAGAVVDLPATLAWSSVAEALEYRIEVMDPRGELLAEAVVADTTWTLEGVSPGVVRWWVRAILPTGTPVASGMAELTVR